MEKVGQKIASPPQNLPIEAFSNFIQQLNVFRRHLATYPSEHPVLAFSAEKVLSLLPEVFRDAEKVQCAVVKKNLFLNEAQLDPKNKSFQDFSNALSSKGIVLLNFSKGFTHAELLNFCDFLNQSQDQIMEQGGIELSIKQRNFQHIQALKMNYDAFQVVEGVQSSQEGEEKPKEPESLWEKFARSLVEDSADLIGNSSKDPVVDPVQLADLLNCKHNLSDENDLFLGSSWASFRKRFFLTTAH